MEKEKITGGLKELLSIRVEDVMLKEVKSVNLDSPIRNAIKIMNESGLGCLIVLSNNRIGGIITEHDILKRVIGENRDLDRLTVQDIQSKPIWITKPKDKVETVLQEMLKRNLMHLPVIEKDTVKGIVTLAEIARIQPKLFEKLKELAEKNKTQSTKKLWSNYIA